MSDEEALQTVSDKKGKGYKCFDTHLFKESLKSDVVRACNSALRKLNK